MEILTNLKKKCNIPVFPDDTNSQMTKIYYPTKRQKSCLKKRSKAGFITTMPQSVKGGSQFINLIFLDFTAWTKLVHILSQVK